jgi:acylphosphatase
MTSSSNSPSSLVHAHILVSGRVQGVGYRVTTADMARLLKLNGWVRNLSDGRVEAVFEGPRSAVDEMLQWCHQGPPAAAVESVQVDYGEVEGLSPFTVRYGRSY